MVKLANRTFKTKNYPTAVIASSEERRRLMQEAALKRQATKDGTHLRAKVSYSNWP